MPEPSDHRLPSEDGQDETAPSRRELMAVGAVAGVAATTLVATAASAQQGQPSGGAARQVAAAAPAAAPESPTGTGLLVWIKQGQPPNDDHYYYIAKRDLPYFEITDKVNNKDAIKKRLRRVGHGVGLKKAIYGNLGSGKLAPNPGSPSIHQDLPAPDSGKIYAAEMTTNGRIAETEDDYFPDDPDL